MAINKVKIRLQGHEKFALREGWLNKGLEILSDPSISDAFTRKDAPDIFGVGSNMVKSIRYWMKAVGLTKDNGTELSELGELVAKYDTYLEKDFTLWLLHSNIAKNIEEATTWYMYFNRCDADDLGKDEIEAILLREVTKYANGQKFSEKSLKNDVDVLVNMYSKTKEKYDPEDKNVSPFVRLGLVKKYDGKYIKSHPDKRLLNEQVVLYELAQRLEGRDSVSIEEAIDSEKGLSKIFNITSVMANGILDRLDAEGYIRVDRTAGLDMIYPVKTISARNVVLDYYTNC